MYDSRSRSDSSKQENIIRSLVSRGVVTKVDASSKMQMLDLHLENGHKPTKVEHWERYGHTQHPHEGAEVMVFAVGGDRDHLIAMDVADRRHRLKGFAAGESAMHDEQGQKVHIKRDGIEIKSDGKTVWIKATNIELEGAIKVKGNITQEGGINSTGVHKAAGHT